jgi:hypothetical protein
MSTPAATEQPASGGPRAAGFELAKQEMEYRVELFGKCVTGTRGARKSLTVGEHRLTSACFEKCVDKKCDTRGLLPLALANCPHTAQVQGRGLERGGEQLHRPLRRQVLAGQPPCLELHGRALTLYFRLLE